MSTITGIEAISEVKNILKYWFDKDVFAFENNKSTSEYLLFYDMKSSEKLSIYTAEFEEPPYPIRGEQYYRLINNTSDKFNDWCVDTLEYLKTNMIDWGEWENLTYELEDQEIRNLQFQLIDTSSNAEILDRILDKGIVISTSDKSNGAFISSVESYINFISGVENSSYKIPYEAPVQP